MKHLACFTAILTIVFGCLSSCNKLIVVENGITAGKYTNFIGNYIVPDSLFLQFYPEYTDYPFILQKNILVLCWSGLNIKSSYWKTAELYKQLSEKYNDTDYNDRLPFPNAHVTLSEDIVDMQITALTNFNARHPLGSSLNDIAFCSYASYSSYINNHYDYEEGGEYRDMALYSQQMVNDLVQTGLTLLQLYPRQGEYHSANIAFLESPEQARQKICVEVFFENNTVARDTIEVDFVN